MIERHRDSRRAVHPAAVAFHHAPLAGLPRLRQPFGVTPAVRKRLPWLQINLLTAFIAGAAIPIVLTVLGQDPAQSSSIILTTVTNVTGFFSFLGIAPLLAGLI